MSKNGFSIIVKAIYCFIVMLSVFSCKKPAIVPINTNGLQTIKIKDIQHVPPLDFEQFIDRIRYVFLQNPEKESIHIDKILLPGKRIYILDKSKSTLLIYDQTGTIQTVIKDVNAFDLYKGSIYTYNILSGILKTYNKEGICTGQNNIGFRGVDFINLNDSLFAFHTAGLITNDRGSTKYEVAFVHKNGDLYKLTIPIPEEKQGVNYAATGRFSLDEGNIYFIPSLKNELYQLNPNKVTSRIKFDFGPLTLTDRAFKSFKDIEDYNFFPYVFNITNKFNTPDYSFFSCTYKGTEAYFIVQKLKKQLTIIGLSSSSGIHSNFNNTIPQAFSENGYVSVIESAEFKKDYILSKSNNLSHVNTAISKLDQEKILQNKNPVLMFYKLKNLDLYNDIIVNDLHQLNHHTN